tara:strand:+ start:1591 stop:1704 length:114 start_codon:yes stop_codon:yes gene_type:complete
MQIRIKRYAKITGAAQIVKITAAIVASSEMGAFKMSL